MKANKLATILGIASLATGTLIAGPFIVVQPPSVVIAPPVVTVPAPAVTVSVGVPDTYVWDGSENVGLVGSQYYYLGAGNVWLPMDSPRLARFNGWERGHPDWRAQAIRNDRYRHDAHGHNVPFHDSHADPHAAPQHYDGHDVHNDGHDMDHHDHDGH